MIALDPKHAEYLESKYRLYRLLVRVEVAVTMMILVTLFITTVVQVASRYLFTAPISGTEELARITLIWFTFISASFIAARRKHIIVDVYGGGKSGRRGSIIESVAYTVTAATGLIVAIGGVQLVSATWSVSSPGLELPMMFIYSAIPIGFSLLVLHAVFNMVLSLKHPAQFAAQSDASEVAS